MAHRLIAPLYVLHRRSPPKIGRSRLNPRHVTMPRAPVVHSSVSPTDSYSKVKHKGFSFAALHQSPPMHLFTQSVHHRSTALFHHPVLFHHFAMSAQAIFIDPVTSIIFVPGFPNKFVGFSGLQRRKTIMIHSLYYCDREHDKGPFSELNYEERPGKENR